MHLQRRSLTFDIHNMKKFLKNKEFDIIIFNEKDNILDIIEKQKGFERLPRVRMPISNPKLCLCANFTLCII